MQTNTIGLLVCNATCLYINITDPWHGISNNVVCATSKGSDQHAHMLVAWIFLTVQLLTEHHFEFLSWKKGCTGWSESTLVKMPLCCTNQVIIYRPSQLYWAWWWRPRYGSSINWIGNYRNYRIINSYSMGCPPVRGLSYVQVDKHGINILYHLHHTYISVNLTHHEIFRAKVGKSGIKEWNWSIIWYFWCVILFKYRCDNISLFK